MATYRLSQNAKDDLQRIYLYGVNQFGEAQADQYFWQFFAAFERIAENPSLYPSVEYIRRGYRRCQCGSDSIFYRVSDNVVEIMAIIGGQDVDDWL